MPFAEAVRVAFASLRANTLRSILTVLGILIGVASVIAVVAIIDGLDGYVAERVLELGTKSFTVQKMPDVITSADQWIEMSKRKDLDLRDLEAVRNACSACLEVGAMESTRRDARYGSTTQEDVQVMGITENVSRIGSVRDLITGRQLLPDDVDSARSVAVIGADLMDAFFGQAEPLGKQILVDNRPYRVVGVAGRKGSIFGSSQDNFVWIPITYFRKVYGTRRSVTIQAEAASMAGFERAQDQARVTMRVRRHLAYEDPDDFSIETGESVLDLWRSFTRGIYAATLLVTLISLVVGGVVVMNIMLVSVTERTSEIGMRKAVGANRRDILRQFLVESVVLAAFGGVLGVLGAVVFAKGLGAVIGGIMSADFVAPVRLWAVLLAVLVAGGVGLLAGLYPASRAASLDPVTALRAE
jgi:putative ABC transport system permease protein